MARILSKVKAGEPKAKRLFNAWGYRPGRNSSRTKLRIRTLRKALPTDGVMKGVESMTVSSDGLQRVTAGTVVPGTQARGRVKIKRANLTPRPAKGTKVVSPPSPTNRGGVRSPYRKTI